MRNIIIDNTLINSDNALIKLINSKKELTLLFSKDSITEVPIAGIIKGKFISRRIDRLIKNDEFEYIMFLDYKTDINKEKFHNDYIFQMNEYKEYFLQYLWKK